MQRREGDIEKRNARARPLHSRAPRALSSPCTPLVPRVSCVCALPVVGRKRRGREKRWYPRLPTKPAPQASIQREAGKGLVRLCVPSPLYGLPLPCSLAPRSVCAPRALLYTKPAVLPACTLGYLVLARDAPYPSNVGAPAKSAPTV